MTDEVQKIRETVENRYEYWKEKESNSHSMESEIRMSECKHLLLMLDSLQEEPVSEDLEEAAKNVGQKYFPDENNVWARPNYEAVKAECAFKNGTQWQKEHLWKPADSDDLPEIDREVIALLDNGKVVFAHRPPEYWDVKNIVTGKVTRNYPKTYGKGDWNIPNIVYWLDVEFPKEKEL